MINNIKAMTIDLNKIEWIRILMRRGVKTICSGFLLTVIFVSSTVLPLDADIYRYIDKNGVQHFSNTPTSPLYRVYIRSRSSRSRFSNVYSPDHYNHIITKASKTYGIDVPLIKAVIKVESNFNPKAISKAGARGLMQIMPTNFKALRIRDPFDPDQNIMGGASLLKELLIRFDGNVHFALAAYNAGPASVDRLKQIPPIKETREFVRKVMEYYSYFKKQTRM
jgi:soluble lytic murein transglycosylase-like protein